MEKEWQGVEGLRAQVEAASEALKALEAPARESAEAIDQAFAKAGASVVRSLGRAASDGKITMSELAAAVITAINSASGQSGGSGSLATVLGDIFSGASKSFSGARADGGPVTAGGSYLVGERGPEWFRPATSGTIETGAGGPVVNLTLNMDGGAAGLLRSEAQIAAMLNRAARMGGR
ncbi:MAG: phage tail tape measure protein [Asticcacaulis sp.]